MRKEEVARGQKPSLRKWICVRAKGERPLGKKPSLIVRFAQRIKDRKDRKPSLRKALKDKDRKDRNLLRVKRHTQSAKG